MTKRQSGESLWTDFGPREVIPEKEVQAQANQLTLMVDEWINDNVKFVDPFTWESPDEKYYRNKAILEVSGYLLNCCGVGNDDPPSKLNKMIIDRVNDRRFAHRILRSPKHLHHLAYPVLYVYYTNELEEKPAAALEKTVELESFWKTDMSPQRQLEYCFLSKHFSQMFGYTQTKYDEDRILKNTQLNHQPSIIRCELFDAYSLTHDIMFYNNHLGVLADAFPDKPAPYDISDLLQGLILRYMAEDNCDIVLELLLCGVLQRQISRQMIQLVLSWVIEKVDELGYVPGPAEKSANVMNLPFSARQDLGQEDNKDGRWDYKSEQEEVWGENFHANIVAGMTARHIIRDWHKIGNRPINNDINKCTFRKDVVRLGELLKSLADYNLKCGAKQMKALAESPLTTEYQPVFQEAIRFLKNQQTQDGAFGYWTDEKILYTTAGNSPESFQNELVKPISKACQEALTAVEEID